MLVEGVGGGASYVFTSWKHLIPPVSRERTGGGVLACLHAVGSNRYQLASEATLE